MLITADPHRDFLNEDERREEWLNSRPVCDCCGHPIQDEYCWEVDGDTMCEECWEEYVKDNFRRPVEEVY